MATSAATGMTTPEAVAAVEDHHDTDLYNLNVKTADGTQVIYTTASHPFYPREEEVGPGLQAEEGHRDVRESDEQGGSMRVTGQSPFSGSDIVLTGMDLSDADLSDRKVNYFTAVSSRFARCDFSGMQVSRGGTFGGGGDYTEYVDCMFDRAAFVGVSAGRATFSRCMFRDVKIRHLFSHEGEFIDCLFTGGIKTAIFYGQPYQHGVVPNPKALLQFTGNDLSGAVLEDVGFRAGIDLSRQSLPEGEDYIFQLRSGPVLRRAWEIAEALPLEDPRRRGVRAALRVQLDKLNDGQEDLFLSLVNRRDAAGGQALKEVLTRAQAEV